MFTSKFIHVTLALIFCAFTLQSTKGSEEAHHIKYFSQKRAGRSSLIPFPRVGRSQISGFIGADPWNDKTSDNDQYKKLEDKIIQGINNCMYGCVHDGGY
uniref:Uncharacterized protein n=1 Tax=Lepeophtheirus salmonis TaxID=72036 RepID=A0A0K2TN68_LEPSM